ncbi:hypothetical protein CLU81_2105 [Flavobacterium sp. 9]|uniref:hypothetical protein n=1 Tax=Flavobacterium sp. 9 TaxID=2035198 RepID=UPI000C1A069C|nr:hypothetical protein [Flavobacterium sp. 9]PIF31603.1 hypothetical protein CLU81_2105 [Flavobacterium sp. 9]
MKKIMLGLFLIVNTVYAQKRDVIYRITADSYPTIGYAYVVSVLYLKEDNSYRLLEQQYNSRKMARKNILRRSNDEYGVWKMIGDTLELYDDKNRPPAKFIIIDDKKIAFLFDDNERSDSYWIKVKN